MRGDYDGAGCEWCRGDGKDHGTLGMATVRDCPRCEGSGRVYVTNRESTTGRRRVYKGPAPKPVPVAQNSADPSSVPAVHEKTPPVKKRRGRKKKRRVRGRNHAA